MSDSVRPHRRQPTRLPHPWDSPGKNTGVGCHFLLQCMKVQSESEVSQSCPTYSDPMDCSLPGSSVDGIFQARVLESGAFSLSEWQGRAAPISMYQGSSTQDDHKRDANWHIQSSWATEIFFILGSNQFWLGFLWPGLPGSGQLFLP